MTTTARKRFLLTRDAHDKRPLQGSAASTLPIASVLMLVLVITCLGIGTGAAEEKTTNTGQDPTSPLTRFDIRYENDQLYYDDEAGNDPESDTLILRVDAPVPLGIKGNSGILYLRADMPISSSQSTGPGDDGTFGFGSVYFQALHIVPKRWGNLPKASGWAWGYAAQLPTSTNGRKKRTDILVYGTKWNLKIGQNPKSRHGSFTTPVFKYFTGPAEVDNGFDRINELHILPLINFGIPKGLDFLTLWGNYDWVLNFEDGTVTDKQKGDFAIPYDITLGKLLSGGKVVLSGTIGGDLYTSDNFKQYDKRFMLRFGFFF